MVDDGDQLSSRTSSPSPSLTLGETSILSGILPASAAEATSDASEEEGRSDVTHPGECVLPGAAPGHDVDSSASSTAQSVHQPWNVNDWSSHACVQLPSLPATNSTDDAAMAGSSLRSHAANGVATHRATRIRCVREELAHVMSRQEEHREQNEAAVYAHREQFSLRVARLSELKQEYQKFASETASEQEVVLELRATVEARCCELADMRQQQDAQVHALRAQLQAYREEFAASTASENWCERQHVLQSRDSANNGCSEIEALEARRNAALGDAEFKAEAEFGAIARTEQQQDRHWIDNFQRVRVLCKQGQEQDEELHAAIAYHRQRLQACNDSSGSSPVAS